MQRMQTSLPALPGEPRPEGRPAPADVLRLMGVLPGLAAAGWLLATGPLLLLRDVVGAYRPWIAGPLGVAGAALLVLPVLRAERATWTAAGGRTDAGDGTRAPGLVDHVDVDEARDGAVVGGGVGTGDAEAPDPAEDGRTDGWLVAAVVTVAAAFGALAAWTSGEHVLLRRDAGSYVQAAELLRVEGRPRLDVNLEALGGADPSLLISSPGFYLDGDHVVPQFLPGQPSLLAIAGWFGGYDAMLMLTALTGALAVLAVGALASALIGLRGALVVAACTAASFPMLHVSRAPYSEPLAVLLLVTGLLLLHRATTGPDAPLRWRFAVAGAVLGAGCLVRLDALTVVTLLTPYAGWLWYARRPAGRGFAVGLGAVTAWAALMAGRLNADYLRVNEVSVRPLVVGTLTVLAATVLGVAVATVRRRQRTAEQEPATPVPPLAVLLAPWAGAAVVLAGIGLALRPLVITTRTTERDRNREAAIAAMQRFEGETVDPTRTYDERSVQWLTWWLGIPLVVVALAGAAVLTVRLLRGREQAWWPVWFAGLGGTFVVLARPGITPDHPWADRRLVPVAIWATVLLAGYALTVLPLPSRLRTGAMVVSAAVLLVPILDATRPLATVSTERGAVGVLDAGCEAFGDDEVALLLDGRSFNEWTPGLRACGIPTAGVAPAIRLFGGGSQPQRDVAAAAVRAVADRVRAAGRVPVFAAVDERSLELAGIGPATLVASVESTTDESVLERRPRATARLVFSFYVARAATGTS